MEKFLDRLLWPPYDIPEMPTEPLQRDQADSLRMAIEDAVEAVRRRSPFSNFPSDRAVKLWPRGWQGDIEDPFLNAVCWWADTFFLDCADAFARAVEPNIVVETWVGKVDKFELVGRIIDHLRRYERMNDPYLMEHYKPPRRKRRKSEPPSGQGAGGGHGPPAA
jgi:hypothetical protein